MIDKRYFFSNLNLPGEYKYNSELDILDIDVNETLSNEHLGLKFLEKLDRTVESYARFLMTQNITRKELIEKILKRLEGYSYDKFKKYGEEMGKRTVIDPNWAEVLSQLDTTKVYAWSTSPKEVVYPFIKEKVEPYYNGKIKITSTEVEVKNNKLTGKAVRIIDETERINLQLLRNSKLY